MIGLTLTKKEIEKMEKVDRVATNLKAETKGHRRYGVIN